MSDHDEVTRLPVPCLVVLVGPSSVGKSTWAAAHFTADEIVSSDRLRAVVGYAEDDLDATEDAFALLDTIVDHRLRRGLTTVVDTLGLDDERRAGYRGVAAEYGVPCVAVGFDLPVEMGRARNRERTHPLPATALKQQFDRWAEVRDRLDGEGFDRVLTPVSVRQVPAHLTEAVSRRAPTEAPPGAVRFGLHVSAFPWEDIAEGLAITAAAAEAAGFTSLWVMDHVRQIPQVGRDWDPMLEPYTALAWLAAHTTRVTLGALVTPVTFRNVGLLAKVIATLDLVSGGRARCGLGLGWYEREHTAYGWAFPPVPDRYALLEDALEALPKLWGPGAKPFEGRSLHLPETIGYPRPLQERVPILVGGGGERRTLRLAARYADAVNIMGSSGVVRRKIAALHRHLDDLDRDHGEVSVTHLAPTLVGVDHHQLDGLVDGLRPRRQSPVAYRAAVNAGTVEDQVDRVHELVAAGVTEVIVSLPDLGQDGTAPVDRWAPIVAAFA
ncbi:MAG: TIGR03560 family F420-dependent LLM class oxidoreductase [Acidimicrobiales bacterium]